MTSTEEIPETPGSLTRPVLPPPEESPEAVAMKLAPTEGTTPFGEDLRFSSFDSQS